MSALSAVEKIAVPEGKAVLHILNSNGDSTRFYDPKIEAEVEEAMRDFDASMEKGMQAVAMNASGEGTMTHSREDLKTATRTVVWNQTQGG